MRQPGRDDRIVSTRQSSPASRLPHPDLVTPNACASGERVRGRRESSHGLAVLRWQFTPRAEEPQDWCECSHLACTCFSAGRFRGLPSVISPPRRAYSSPSSLILYHRFLSANLPQNDLWRTEETHTRRTLPLQPNPARDVQREIADLPATRFKTLAIE